MSYVRTLTALCFLTSLAPLACAEPQPLRQEAPLRVARVTHTVALEAQTLIRIQAGDETITATPEHPFALAGGGWTPAGKLAPSDTLVTSLRESSPAVGATQRLSVARPRSTT